MYKYVNKWRTPHREVGNDIFGLRLANPQVAPELETLMTTNKPQMAKLQGTVLSSSPHPTPGHAFVCANNTLPSQMLPAQGGDHTLSRRLRLFSFFFFKD